MGPERCLAHGLLSVEISWPAAVAQKPPRALLRKQTRGFWWVQLLPSRGTFRQASFPTVPFAGRCFVFPFLSLCGPCGLKSRGCSRAALFGSNDLQGHHREEGPGLGAWEAGPGRCGLWGERCCFPCISVSERKAGSLLAGAGTSSQARTEARTEARPPQGCRAGSVAGCLAGLAGRLGPWWIPAWAGGAILSAGGTEVGPKGTGCTRSEQAGLRTSPPGLRESERRPLGTTWFWEKEEPGRAWCLPLNKALRRAGSSLTGEGRFIPGSLAQELLGPRSGRWSWPQWGAPQLAAPPAPGGALRPRKETNKTVFVECSFGDLMAGPCRWRASALPGGLEMAREGCDRASEGDDGQGSCGPPLLAVARLVFGLDAGREESGCRESLVKVTVVCRSTLLWFPSPRQAPCWAGSGS